jgi:hypothetical protein
LPVDRLAVFNTPFRSFSHSPAVSSLRKFVFLPIDTAQLIGISSITAVGLFAAVCSSRLCFSSEILSSFCLEDGCSSFPRLSCVLHCHWSTYVSCSSLRWSRFFTEKIRVVYVNSLLASLNMRARLSKQDRSMSVSGSTRLSSRNPLEIRAPSGVKVCSTCYFDQSRLTSMAGYFCPL